jgi:uncharacterized membrane protein YccC
VQPRTTITTASGHRVLRHSAFGVAALAGGIVLGHLLPAALQLPAFFTAVTLVTVFAAVAHEQPAEQRHQAGWPAILITLVFGLGPSSLEQRSTVTPLLFMFSLAVLLGLILGLSLH